MSFDLEWMRDRFRELTGRSTTTEITDAAVNSRINDFYQNRFPLIAEVQGLLADWTQEAAVDDDGEYALTSGEIDLRKPITANGDEITRVLDPVEFWRAYPNEEDFISDPSLAIGSSSAAAVANSAFKYQVSSWTYSKAAAETALSGDAVPQNKYGAWMLEIDSDGTITVQEADDNATGYDTPGRAVNALPGVSADNIAMGFVTVINTSGTFTPGTTELDASGVTATYTDGDPGLRGQPQAVLVAADKLYLRPKANDTYMLRAKLSLTEPDELSSDTDTPADESWATLIASGTAIEYLSQKGEYTRVQEIMGDAQGNTPGTYNFLLNTVNRKQLKQWQGRRVMREF